MKLNRSIHGKDLIKTSDKERGNRVETDTKGQEEESQEETKFISKYKVIRNDFNAPYNPRAPFGNS